MSWLRALKLTWIKMQIRKERPLAVALHKRRRTSRFLDEVSPLPSAAAWIGSHPVNGTAWLTDEGAAILRLLRADGGVSKIRQPVIFSLMYTFFFKVLFRRILGLSYRRGTTFIFEITPPPHFFFDL